ncbi:MAG: response regulator transcription factor [Chloroflexota bacterium]
MDEHHLIRVLVVDDHDMLRMSLASFLENFDDMVMVGEARNGQEAVNLCHSLHPDVVLMDLGMPVMDGMTATTLINRDLPFIHIIILTSTFSDDKRQAAFNAGASAYFRKNISVDTLVNAIRKAAA